jgi:hypothetical protein
MIEAAFLFIVLDLFLDPISSTAFSSLEGFGTFNLGLPQTGLWVFEYDDSATMSRVLALSRKGLINQLVLG